MIRIPATLYNRITFPLQLLASSMAETTLNLIGIPVFREGNILELSNQKLSVVEACSGIRSLLSLTTLAIIYGYFLDSKIWRRCLLVIAALVLFLGREAGPHVDLDLREMRAERLDREGIGIGPARALADHRVVLELFRDLVDRRARALADDVPALELELGAPHLEDARGQVVPR